MGPDGVGGGGFKAKISKQFILYLMYASSNNKNFVYFFFSFFFANLYIMPHSMLYATPAFLRKQN